MIWILVWFLCAIVCAVIARAQNRSAAGWFFVGLFLGPLGLLIAAVVSRVVLCDYCGGRVPPYGARKRELTLAGNKGNLKFCRPEHRNKFLRDLQTQGIDFRTGDSPRPFDDT